MVRPFLILFEFNPLKKIFTESWKFFKGLENLVLNRKCMWWLTFEIKIRINNYFPPCRALCILRCRFNEHHFVKERFKNSFFDDAGQPPFARINLLNYPSLPKFIKTKCITETDLKFECFSKTINCFGTTCYIHCFDIIFFKLKWSLWFLIFLNAGISKCDFLIPKFMEIKCITEIAWNFFKNQLIDNGIVTSIVGNFRLSE